MADARASISAADQSALLPVVYDQLHDLARRLMGDEPAGHTLQPTALIHEAWLRLAAQQQQAWRDRGHFVAMAARVMRRVLVDAARRRRAAKRGGDRWRVTLMDFPDLPAVSCSDLLALDEALERLEKEDERLGRVVELRFFGGMTVREVAAVMDQSRSSVDTDWHLARAWLHRELAEREA